MAFRVLGQQTKISFWNHIENDQIQKILAKVVSSFDSSNRSLCIDDQDIYEKENWQQTIAQVKSIYIHSLQIWNSKSFTIGHIVQAQFPDLKSLYLDLNDGLVSIQGLGFIYFKNLEKLSLNFTNVSNINSLKKLNGKNLTHLNIFCQVNDKCADILGRIQFQSQKNIRNEISIDFNDNSSRQKINDIRILNKNQNLHSVWSRSNNFNTESKGIKVTKSRFCFL